MKLRVSILCTFACLSACTSNGGKTEGGKTEPEPYFHADPATAGSISGVIRFSGRKAPPKPISMDSEAGCADQHPGGRVLDESLIADQGKLANVFVYLKTGLEGRKFETPAAPVTIDQRGCWFEPRVFGIQTGQTLQVTNSDPVTHNIHPQARVNREWNQSQGPGDPPLKRRFTRPEILVPVKCNIHRWMHAFIGVVDHPYFAVSDRDGSFQINNVPPGEYTIAVIHETLGSQEANVVLTALGKASVDFTFKGE